MRLGEFIKQCPASVELLGGLRQIETTAHRLAPRKPMGSGNRRDYSLAEIRLMLARRTVQEQLAPLLGDNITTTPWAVEQIQEQVAARMPYGIQIEIRPEESGRQRHTRPARLQVTIDPAVRDEMMSLYLLEML